MAGPLLNNAQTGDGYTALASCQFSRPTTKVNLIIANAAVYVRYEIGQGGRPSGNYTLEQYQVPGVGSKTDPIGNGGPVIGVQLRSAAPGKPAMVSAAPA